MLQGFGQCAWQFARLPVGSTNFQFHRLSLWQELSTRLHENFAYMQNAWAFCIRIGMLLFSISSSYFLNILLHTFDMQLSACIYCYIYEWKFFVNGKMQYKKQPKNLVKCNGINKLILHWGQHIW
jgi:hypothetical protein